MRVQIRTGRAALVEPRQQPFDATGAPLCLVCMHRAPLPATGADPDQVKAPACRSPLHTRLVSRGLSEC